MQLRVLAGQMGGIYTFLHYAVINPYDKIVMASFGGRRSDVERTVRIIKNKRPHIDVLHDGRLRRHGLISGEYNFTTSGIDEGVMHAVMMHKSCIQSDTPIHFVIASEDYCDALNNFFVERFALPEQWKDRYLSLFENYIQELYVMKNPLCPDLKNIKAFQISISEERVLSIVDRCLKEMELLIPTDTDTKGTFCTNWNMRDYLQHNAAEIAHNIEQLQPYHDSENPNRRLCKWIATMGRVPLPRQADIVQGVFNRLQSEDYAFINGAAGTGKSIMFNALVNCWHHKVNRGGYTPVLLTTPATVIPKWIADEIKEDIPEARIVCLNNTEEALQYAREDHSKKRGIEYVIVSLDRVKLGPMSWAGSALWRHIGTTRRFAWHCPDCGKVLYDPKRQDRNGNYLPAAWDVMAEGEPTKDRSAIQWKRNSKLVKCNHCNTKLWRPANKQLNDHKARASRWHISRIFQKKLRKHFDLYGADEIHKQKTASQRGQAFGSLVNAAKKVVGLTATLNNGMSTAVKELFWRVDPNRLLAKGFDHDTGTVVWATNYGAMEYHRIEQTREGDRVRRITRTIEKPGVSPQLVAEYLLDCVAYLELKDLGFPLVEKHEIPIFVEMDSRHQEEYEAFHLRLADFGRRGRGVVPAAINYADTPAHGIEHVIRWRHRGQIEERTVSAPPLPGYSAKERRLVQVIRTNLVENRGVVVFTYYTGKYRTNQRLKKVLADHGIDAAVLPSSLSPNKRVDWLEQQAKNKQKVIIANLALIGEGIDLLEWPSLVFYQLSYNIDMVRQAGGRAWRIGQLRECRNYYLVTNGTQQVPQFETIMAKRGHALLVEGKIDQSALADYSQDAFSTLAADIVACLVDTKKAEQVKTQWQTYADIDLEGIETITENKYRTSMQQAMKQLVETTKRFCGITNDTTIGRLWLPDHISISPIESMLRRGRRVIAVPGQLQLVINE